MIKLAALLLAVTLEHGEQLLVECHAPALRVVAVGDSITQGSTTGGGWPGLLDSDYVHFSNIAISAAVGAGCLGNWKYNGKPYHADAAVILCGLNDIKNNSFSTPQQAFDAQLWMYNDVLAGGAQLYLVSLLPAKFHGGICAPNTGTSCAHYHNGTGTHSVDHGVPCETALQPGDIPAFNALLQAYAASHPGAHYIDAYSLFLNPDGTQNTSLYYYEYEGDRDCDGAIESIYVHLNTAGRAVLAGAVAAALGI